MSRETVKHWQYNCSGQYCSGQHAQQLKKTQ